MNILCMAPVMAKSLCDDYYMYKRVVDKGSQLVFITGQSSGDRAGGIKLPAYENNDGFPIYRLYNDAREMFIFPKRRLKEVKRIANNLKPDVILCHLHHNMPLALLLQKHLKIPIVLHVESAGVYQRTSNIASWKMMPFYRLQGMPRGGVELWNWLCQRADSLITSDPKDEHQLKLLKKSGKPIFYIPWPASVPKGCELSLDRNKNRAIYAGNLIPFKNTQVFKEILPLILEKTPTQEFIVVGTGVHASMILELKRQFSDRINYIPRMTRWEVIKLISGSYYALTPVKDGGLGFMGDCWGTQTPLVMLHNVFEAKGLDPCVAKSQDDLIVKINRLYEDQSFYRQLQEIGCEAYRKRAYDVVGDELLGVLSKVNASD